MNFQNDEHEGWKEPIPVITDKQFMTAVLVILMLFITIKIYFYYAKNTNNDQVQIESADQCEHN